MKLTTRSLRNISFAAMLAVVPFVGEVPVLAVNCGPYICTHGCGEAGTYMLWQGCTEGTCFTGQLCSMGGENCTILCMACPGEGQYDCQELPVPQA